MLRNQRACASIADVVRGLSDQRLIAFGEEQFGLFGRRERCKSVMVRAGAATDIGKTRVRNEDAYLVAPPLYAIADGMGGQRGGNTASSIALRVIAGANTLDDLLRAARVANAQILERSREEPALSGMGTTLTACLIQGGQLHIVHVGDSRAYLFRGGDLRALTRDHSFVQEMVDLGKLTAEEARVHPQRNLLVRALGIGDSIDLDESAVALASGDRLLLCSDGLHSVVNHDEIRSWVGSVENPEDAARRLVEAANDAGGPDNSTAVTVYVDEVS